MKKSYYTIKLLLIFSLFALTPLAKSQVPSQSTDIMLQGFGWDSYSASNWATLTSMAPEIGQNFDLIWLPPSGNDLTTNSMGYLPVFYFDQNSSFGTQAELKTLIQTLNNNGTKAIADIVINHRNGETNWVDFPVETYNGTTHSWGLEAICEGDEVKDQNLAYDHTPTGNPDTGENYAAARDVDHTNVNVQNTIKAYLDFLKNEIGYDGWRYDLVKGYEGGYTAMYNNSANAYLSVGEFWDGNYDLVTGWIDATNATSTAFDFPAKYALNNAFNNGYNLTELTWLSGTENQPAGLIHNDYYKKYAITFVDNHDTGRSDNASRFTGNVLAAYAFILSSPGIPCVWMNHWNDANYTTKINELIEARKLAGLHSESNVTVNQSAQDIYVATATGNNGSLIVKIGTASYDAPTDYTLQTSGTDYAVWTKTATDPTPNPEPTPTSTITVKFYNNNTSWSNVNVHAWDDSGTLNTWPGESMTNEGDNWFSYTFSSVTGYLNVIFNDGTDQTIDITNIDADACFSTTTTTDGDGHLHHIEVNCTDGTTTAPISVAYQNTQAWSDIYIYTWDNTGAELTGTWPGTAITEFQDGWYRYDFEASVNHVNVIFNNGAGSQTGNIEGITSTSCYAGTTPDYVECPSVVTSVAKTENTGNQLEIFPNPVKNFIQILSSQQVEKVSIASINGNITDLFEAVNQNTRIDVSHLSPGLYFIIVQDVTGKETIGRFIKQ
ncbi:putative secreted protein (Por secretion system target) [Marinilabilia salmonicolor]|jgi:alpha-amylase|uniref:starch-binding protein n=1 Tax=Marinilabilia salmonicolor TaxID=989 RepID=UPI000D058B20|nr:starch-binding protein [Marinilabilia salmonicolor]PRZ00286.1 putative secreted protein (Por secretion system target) [Marinilabilia salmonicolor]